MSKFYVYMYLDRDNVPFYIGKGKNNRYYVSSQETKQKISESKKGHKISISTREKMCVAQKKRQERERLEGVIHGCS